MCNRNWLISNSWRKCCLAQTHLYPAQIHLHFHAFNRWDEQETDTFLTVKSRHLGLKWKQAARENAISVVVVGPKPDCKTARRLGVQPGKKATCHHTGATQFNLRLDEGKASIILIYRVSLVNMLVYWLLWHFQTACFILSTIANPKINHLLSHKMKKSRKSSKLGGWVWVISPHVLEKWLKRFDIYSISIYEKGPSIISKHFVQSNASTVGYCRFTLKFHTTTTRHLEVIPPTWRREQPWQ